MSDEPQNPESYKEMMSTFTLFHKVVLVALTLISFGGGCMTLGMNVHRVSQVEDRMNVTNHKIERLTDEISKGNDLLISFMQQGERLTFEDFVNWYKDSYTQWLNDKTAFPMAKPTRVKHYR